MRITAKESEGAVTIQIEGRLSGPFVTELRNEWQRLTPVLDSRRLSIDLRSLIFADASGIELMAEIYRKTNAKFLADTPLTKHFADQARRNSQDGNQN